MKISASLDFNQVSIAPQTRYHCQVNAIKPLSASVTQIQLTTPNNFPDYRAGQYIELMLDDDTGRPFSIANFTPEHSVLELHIEVKPESRTTCAIIQQLLTQGEIQIKAAKGSVRLKPATGPQVFLAAGTGFAQIKALIEQYLFSLHNTGSEPSHCPPFYLYWGAETPGQRYMQERVESWCRQYENLHYYPLDWQQGQGWEAALATHPDRLLGAQIYACGSPRRVYRTLEFLESHGVNRSQVQSDVFDYAPRPSKQGTG